jgi:hypothetical protein
MATTDKKALAWQKKNRWFGKHERKTTLALILHETLIKAGVDPTTTKYYKLIDEHMASLKYHKLDRA